MATPTTILVDDNDPSIQYGAGWTSNISSLAQSDPGDPIYGTLHVTTTKSILTYSFFGSFITACPYVAGIAQTVSLSSWACSVDGVEAAFDFTDTGNYFCCTADGLDNRAQHKILISATGSQNHPVAFDYLTYGTNLTVSAADLLLYPDNSAFRYTDDWEEFTIPDSLSLDARKAFIATKMFANFTFDFYGSSVLWFGFYNKTFAGYDTGMFQFTVDNGERTPTYLDPTGAQSLNGSEVTEQSLLFRTFALLPGQHRLEVIYLGGITTGKAVPLTLTHLVVQNGTTNPDTSLASPTTLMTPSPSATSNVIKGNRRAHLAIILGCSGVAVLVFFILVILCVRRRLKKRNGVSTKSGTSSLVEPFSHDSASAPNSGTYQKGQNHSEVQEHPVEETAEVEAPPSYITGF